MNNPNCLLVIIPDNLSDLIRKGEVTERYYNPGNLFDEVHILLINHDRPDVRAVQKMVGDARLKIHNLPTGSNLFKSSLGWRPFLLRGWAKPAVELARQIRPRLIRCHGNNLNAFVAYTIKRALGIPYVVSLHTNPEENRLYWTNSSLKERIYANAIKAVEALSLHHADMVLPVYRSLLPYLQHIKAKKFEVCYNVLNPSNLAVKEDYALNAPARIVSVGRQIPGKNPDNIIRALSGLPDVRLTLIGDGSLHEASIALANELGLQDRVEFIRSVDNDSLCANLKEYDIFVVHCDFGGVPKAVLEAFMIGLPVVTNKNAYGPVPEMNSDICMLVDNTAEGYGAAINTLLISAQLRESFGRTAQANAMALWAPEKTEAKVVSVYKEVLDSNG